MTAADRIVPVRGESRTAGMETGSGDSISWGKIAAETAIELDSRSESLIRGFEQPARVLANLGSILFVTTLHYEVRIWNARAAKVLERRADEVEGRHLGACQIDWDWPTIQNQTEEAVSDPIRLDDVPFNSPSGQAGILAFTVTMLRNSEQQPIGMIWFGAEVSDRRRKQLQEVQSHKLALLGRLAAELAHEMNSPLQYIVHNVRFLQHAIEEMRKRRVTDSSQGDRMSNEGRDEAAVVDGEMFDILAEVPEVIDQTLTGLNHLTRVARTLGALAPSSSSSDEMHVPLPSILTEAIERVQREGPLVVPITLKYDGFLDATEYRFPPLLTEVFRCGLLAAIEATSVQLGGNAPLGAVVAVKTKRMANQLEIHIAASDVPLVSITPGSDSNFQEFEGPTNDELGHGLAVARAIMVERFGGELNITKHDGEILHVTLVLPT